MKNIKQIKSEAKPILDKLANYDYNEIKDYVYNSSDDIFLKLLRWYLLVNETSKYYSIFTDEIIDYDLLIEDIIKSFNGEKVNSYNNEDYGEIVKSIADIIRKETDNIENWLEENNIETIDMNEDEGTLITMIIGQHSINELKDIYIDAIIEEIYDQLNNGRY